MHLAVQAPLDRWALVEALGLRPEQAMDLETALARVAHPTAAAIDLVVLVRDEVDLAFLRRVRAVTHGRRRPTVLAVADDRLRIQDVAGAGADAIVPWRASTPFPDGSVLVALDVVEDLDLVVVLPEASPVELRGAARA